MEARASAGRVTVFSPWSDDGGRGDDWRGWQWCLSKGGEGKGEKEKVFHGKLAGVWKQTRGMGDGFILKIWSGSRGG